MEDCSQLSDRLCALALGLGAYRAAVIPADRIVTNAAYRDMCTANACGNYGRCWTCPPSAGDIHVLMARVKTYSHALAYQTVGQLEDSCDYEGMMEAGSVHNRLMLALRERIAEERLPRTLYLGAGGCPVCPVCAKRTDEPCRHPELAVSSLEAYGVDVAAMAEEAGMRYINGENTVTYFGAVLFDMPADPAE